MEGKFSRSFLRLNINSQGWSTQSKVQIQKVDFNFRGLKLLYFNFERKNISIRLLTFNCDSPWHNGVRYTIATEIPIFVPMRPYNRQSKTPWRWLNSENWYLVAVNPIKIVTLYWPLQAQMFLPSTIGRKKHTWQKNTKRVYFRKGCSKWLKWHQ